MGDTESRTKIAESTARQWQQEGMPWEGGKGKRGKEGEKKTLEHEKEFVPEIRLSWKAKEFLCRFG